MSFRHLKYLMTLVVVVIQFTACRFYSFTGGQFSGAKTFSVEYFKPQTAMATFYRGDERFAFVSESAQIA
ncbi:MAG: hypothetical protein IPP69_00545 [Flavobacteriales bacterium]|nr:hypothetical protein [Flavobacteriales bacterium]